MFNCDSLLSSTQAVFSWLNFLATRIDQYT